MRSARLFVSQSVLDRWLTDGTADVSGDTLTIMPDERQFELKTAVLFEREVTESETPRELVGKVKDLDQIAELGGDYSVGTVILGDEAYEVTDGFAGEAVTGDIFPALASIAPPARPRTDPDLATADAALTAVGITSPDDTSDDGGVASDLAAAIGTATGGAKPDNELDLLARFFLEAEMIVVVTVLFALVAVLYSLSGALYLTFLARGSEPVGRNAGYVLTAAVVAHVAFLAADVATTSRPLFADIHQALGFGSLLVALAYLATVWLGGQRITSKSKLQVLGAFITPITLLFFLGAGFRRGVQVSDEVRSIMLPIHIGVNVLGIVAFALAFGVSIAYVIQERQLRQKKLSGIFQRLPSLDTLDTLGFRMVIIGFPLLTLGVVTGTLWAVRLDPDASPIGATQTMGLIEWALFAGVLLLRAVAGWRGRRAAIGTMLGFIVACAVLFGYVLRG